jgi:hypothetical protein
MDTRNILLDRVTDLDRSQDNKMAWAEARTYCETHCIEECDIAVYPCSVLGDIAYLVSVIDRVAGSDFAAGWVAFSPLTGTQADDIMQTSAILERLARNAPQLTIGPLRPDSQFWVATGRPAFPERRHYELDAGAFVDAGVRVKGVHSTKPSAFGIFTSTGICDEYGMWRIYLDMHENSPLYPRPWQTWKVEISSHANIREIASAQDWVHFVDEYSIVKESYCFPDWHRIAEDYDGVHVTLQAVAAVEGIPFHAQAGVIPPAYWGVESTFWLHWCFTDKSLREVIHK